MDIDFPTDEVATSGNNDLALVMRWGWYSIAMNVALIGLHGSIVYASSSLAVGAELLHNLTDLASAAVVVIGLKLAVRKSRDFPYGLYKIENIVAAGLAILIFLTAYEIATTGLTGSFKPPHAEVWMFVILGFTAVLPLVFAHYELRVAEATSSPALRADAREYKVHAYTTGLAFAGLLSGWLETPLDRYAALLIVAVVAKTGWDLMSDALRVLLDASLSPKTLDDIRSVIRTSPGVVSIEWITGRNSGRFRFVEAGIALRHKQLGSAEATIQRIERDVRARIPRVERVLLHIETVMRNRSRHAVPLADAEGNVSDHLGSAPYFAILTVEERTGALQEQLVLANPHVKVSKGKGLRVAEWLMVQNIDVVWLKQDLDGRGPGYVFREAGVDIRRTGAKKLSTTLQEISHAVTGRRVANED